MEEEMLHKNSLSDRLSTSDGASTTSASSPRMARIRSPADPVLTDRWLYPCLGSHADELLANSRNFLSESDVDVLTVAGSDSSVNFARHCRDAAVEDAIESLQGTPEDPAMMILCVRLERVDGATFNYRPSMTKSLTGKIFKRFDINDGFMLDLVGRPSYWASSSDVKADQSTQGDVFEFFCQHPRWHQKGRYDKMEQGATRGNKAPCSVYMSHSPSSNTTFYMVVAPDDGVWLSFMDRIQTGKDEDDNARMPSRRLVESPFQVHAMVACIAFEEASQYAASLRERLMEQLKQVNDYSERQAQSQANHEDVMVGDTETRLRLHGITTQLHSVSQMINTGLGSVHASIKLSNKLLESHVKYCERTGRGEPGSMVAKTDGVLRYLLDSFVLQELWLGQYMSRKDTAMNFVYNMVTQQDSSTNLQMSFNMSQDSSSMHAITILTMIFLPGTFTATLFSTAAFRSTDSGSAEVTDWLWPFAGVGISLTCTVIATWYFRRSLTRIIRFMAMRRDRQLAKGDAGQMA